MVRLTKLLRLGGFLDNDGNAGGFAARFLPLDTPHDESKPRWKVNQLGQKVSDPGMTQAEFRDQYVRALENKCTAEERETYLRALGLLAEKGDTTAAEIVLTFVEKDEAPNVRLTALQNLAFIAKNPTLRCNKMVLDRLGRVLVDKERDIRALIIGIHEKSTASNDAIETETIFNRAKQSIVDSRRICWNRLSEYSVALNSHTKLLLCLCNLMSYPVLPVRICVWEVLSKQRKFHQVTLGESTMQEHRLYQATNELKPKEEEESKAQTDVEKLKLKILDRARDYVAAKIAEMQDRGFVFEAGDHTLLNKLHEQILSGNKSYLELKESAQMKAQQLTEAEINLNREISAYEEISTTLCTEIMEIIAELLNERNQAVLAIHKILGHQDSTAWFVRRVVLQEFIIPLVQENDAKALEILHSCSKDTNCYIKRIIDRTLQNHRRKTAFLHRHRPARKSSISVHTDGSDFAKQSHTDDGMALMSEFLHEAARTISKILKIISAHKQATSLQTHLKTKFQNDDSGGGSSGVGSTLLRNSEGKSLFRRVHPLGEVIDEGDILIKVGETDVTQKTLIEIRHLFEEAGEMCPCVVQRINHGNRKRFVYISCNPPPYYHESLEAIGLDIEIYKNNAIRTLQMLSFLQRKGFGKYVQRIIGDLQLRQLSVLASKYNKPQWIASVGMTQEDEVRFQQELNLLAARLRIEGSDSPRYNLNNKCPLPAHAAWKFIRGKSNLKSETYKAKCRTADVSSTLEDFRINGRLPTLFEKQFEGVDYTVFWHEGLGIFVEFTDCGTGTFRIMLSGAGRNSHLGTHLSDKLPRLEGECFVCFTDGELEPVRSLRATELLHRIKETSLHHEPISFDFVLPDVEEIEGSRVTTTVSGGSFGLKDVWSTFFGPSDLKNAKPIFEDGEHLIGYHIDPEIGMRVLLCSEAKRQFKEMVEECCDGTGTIIWVDEEDADGDGYTGDFCEVKWDNGYVADYRTGFEGQYRLALDHAGTLKQKEEEQRDRYNVFAGEVVVGLDIPAEVGQRVIIRESAIAEIPSLAEDSQGGVGSIVWVDPDDLDGDGKTGDICEVLWDCGVKGEYRTGFEGYFRLALFRPPPRGLKVKARFTEKAGFTKIEDPWKDMEEAEEAKAVADRNFLRKFDTNVFPLGELCTMDVEGASSRMIFGNWTAQTKTHQHGFGSTIAVHFQKRRTKPADEILSDFKRLRSRIGAKDTAGLLSKTGFEMSDSDGRNDDELTIHLTGEGLLFAGVRAEEPIYIRFDGNGPTKMSPNEAAVYSEGTPVELIDMAARTRQAILEGGILPSINQGKRRPKHPNWRPSSSSFI